MKQSCILLIFLALSLSANAQQIADPENYLADTKKELAAVWPKNRTINLVFHGHSVPAGYWHDHEVHTLESYPNLVLKQLKAKYPYAVINVIVTAIGGENSLKGQKRFDSEVLSHKPDVLFIDYALNDRFADIKAVKDAWEKMIQSAKSQQIEVILITPSPDQRLDMLAADNPLEPHVRQIRELAATYNIGLADPYAVFKRIAAGEGIKPYMSHVNHPNEKGHQLIADELLKWF